QRRSPGSHPKRIFRPHARGKLFLKLQNLLRSPAGSIPPKRRPSLDHIQELGPFLVVVELGPPVTRSKRLLSDRFISRPSGRSRGTCRGDKGSSVHDLSL